MSKNRGSKGGIGHDYRREYLKRNKGILGSGIYICPYCGLPGILKNSHIDHIMPKSKSERVFNRQYNLIATHPKCNQKKSDKIDRRVVQGYTAKVFGGVIGGVVNTILNIIFLPLGFVPRLASIVLNVVGFGARTVMRMITGTFSMMLSILIKPLLLIGAILFLVMFMKR